MDQSTLDEYRFWAVGSRRRPGPRRDRASWRRSSWSARVMALAAGPVLNSLALGDDVARSLGSRVGLVRLFAASSVVLLVGAATALAGPIAFVGLTIPHVARAITGPDYRWVLRVLDGARAGPAAGLGRASAGSSPVPASSRSASSPRSSGHRSSSCWSGAAGWPSCDRGRRETDRDRTAGRRPRLAEATVTGRPARLGRRRAGVVALPSACRSRSATSRSRSRTWCPRSSARGDPARAVHRRRAAAAPGARRGPGRGRVRPVRRDVPVAGAQPAGLSRLHRHHLRGLARRGVRHRRAARQRQRHRRRGLRRRADLGRGDLPPRLEARPLLVPPGPRRDRRRGRRRRRDGVPADQGPHLRRAVAPSCG